MVCFWLSAAATFDNEEENLHRSLENEGEYIGKKLSTNSAVPGRLCRDPIYAEFYRDVLKLDTKIIKIVSKGYIVPFDLEPAIGKKNKSY